MSALRDEVVGPYDGLTCLQVRPVRAAGEIAITIIVYSLNIEHIPVLVVHAAPYVLLWLSVDMICLISRVHAADFRF